MKQLFVEIVTQSHQDHLDERGQNTQQISSANGPSNNQPDIREIEQVARPQWRRANSAEFGDGYIHPVVTRNHQRKKVGLIE